MYKDRKIVEGTVVSEGGLHSKLHLRILLKILGRPKAFRCKTVTLYINLGVAYDP